MAIPDSPKSESFTQQVFFCIFSKSNIFQNFQKMQHVVELCLDIWLAKFQGDISIFGKHMAQKPYPWMTAFFQVVILSISGHRTEIRMTFFWNLEIKTIQKQTFLIGNKNNTEI